MSFALRRVTSDDYNRLWKLKEQTMREYVEQTWGTWEAVPQEQHFRRSFSPDLLRVIVAEGRDVGLLHVERLPAEFFLANIQIQPGEQRRGLGSAVIQRVMEEARVAGLPVRLQVLKVNPARRLYERLGFAVFEETATHFVMRWSPK
jgi:GNAT superfamily N-acetyltransferase